MAFISECFKYLMALGVMAGGSTLVIDLLMFAR